MNNRLLTIKRLLPILGWWGLASLIVQRLKGRQLLQLKPRGFDRHLYARFNNSDLSVLYQVFGLNECQVDVEFSPKVIVDGGANVGFTTAYLSKRYPQALILAVEPSDANCELFRKNCASLKNVRLLQGAIWHSNAPICISNPTDRGWMIQVEEAAGTSAGHGEQLPSYTIQDLIDAGEQQRIDILKLDIEGAETEIFSAANLEWIERVNCLIIEVHGDAAREAVSAAMQNRGYRSESIGEKLVFHRPFVLQEELSN